MAKLGETLSRLRRQLEGGNPFTGDLLPTRIPLLDPDSGRPCLPFPHPWNYREPIRILESYFWGADAQQGPGRHSRYLDVPGFHPVLVTRDPAIIRAITVDTGDKPGQFDRDTLPSRGIARATGPDTLLFANGPLWRHQRKISASPFGKTTLFQPERFQEFATTFRHTVHERLNALQQRISRSGHSRITLPLEPEIKAVMLEMLTNNFFGTELSYEQIRHRYVPALERVIDHIVRDSVTNPLGLPLRWIPSLTRSVAQAKADHACFDELTTVTLARRREGRGLWSQFKSDAPDEVLRSNLKVFLAGALEATTSFASWAISQLARHPGAQQQVFEEVATIDDYTPESLERAPRLMSVLDETLRLTPSLYFLPRRATCDVEVETPAGGKLGIPAGTHILLDIWHANRHEDHWGTAVSGYPADAFAPERWAEMTARGRDAKEMLHFGFGHGPRVCPGKHLGQLEVALVVGAFVKLFQFSAPHLDIPPRAGVSTKPRDGTLVEISRR